MVDSDAVADAEGVEKAGTRGPRAVQRSSGRMAEALGRQARAHDKSSGPEDKKSKDEQKTDTGALWLDEDPPGDGPVGACRESLVGLSG